MPPPRTINQALAARLLTGSTMSQIGWLLLGTGSIFFWSFVWHADISGWRFRPELVVETHGQALGCRATGYSEGGGRYRRGTPIYENFYRYEVAGQRFERSSFAKGRCLSGPVMVEYLRPQPGVSRIVGMRRQPFGAWATVVALLPATGLGMVLAGMLIGQGRLRLVRDGLLTTGKLIQTKRTNIQSNNRQVYRLTFEYQAQHGGTGQVTMSTNRPERFSGKEGQELFYDPANLKRAVLVASLPGTLAADEAHQPVARGSMIFLLLPGLTIVGNACYVYRHLMPGP